MSSVISATTGTVMGAASHHGQGTKRVGSFLSAAESLLASASAHLGEGKCDLALEDAYRAALRVAGAVNASSPVIARRKRLPTSAWDKLSLTGEVGKGWAVQFKRYSALRGRVASGIVEHPPRADVVALLDLAYAFYDDAVFGPDGAAVA
ncbi:SAV_6107 family HEPN domain-containing protein [Corynebacterium cystitidis]|uniref:SAV-6107-like HEPN domain-containing protein n=1 Tax=Corynebacterium cystitidis DSM 20524 TaxID=1121357 RepID=A0A1H9NNX1_9CORY|nr:SAV_6107 family HEPN domain-containing protein [Corynebacterium cystitidis]WJY82789.1 hypothetical protein CCYS_09375 [Corynebacterium cystitidis DSM 20524]SER37670.1 hypothetical protein SAMN05661109_00041 [Corynebacterium cystitidis DSM 20524]SNV70507.1 Uncharacterised protein [Corynebacterium cystitidis]